jgi:hypothetical protein
MADLELEAGMDLCRRLRPSAIDKTLDSLCRLLPYLRRRLRRRLRQLLTP